MTYTATASGYGKHLTEDPLMIPVDRNPMSEVLKATDAAAAKEAS